MKETTPTDNHTAPHTNEGVNHQPGQDAPAGTDSADQYEPAKRSQKQPGQDLSDPEEGGHDGE